MAFNYSLTITRRDDSTTRTFTKGVDISELSFGFVKLGGCAGFSAVLTLDDWVDDELYMESDNLVEISADVGLGLALVYTGIIQKLDAAGNTPPGHKSRKIEGYGLIAELKSNGILVLDVYENTSIQDIVIDLITSHFTGATDIDAATTEVTTGDGYSIAKTVFMDLEGEACIKKLAEVYGMVEWGVGADRKLYFRQENNAAVLALQLGEGPDGVTMTRHEYGAPGPNAYIVEGRESRQGNPMAIYEENIAEGDRKRMKKIRAPELIDGADMLAWADYLLDRDSEPAETMQIEVAGIEDKLGEIITATGKIELIDQNGDTVGSWKIQAITYTLNGGIFNATFELGDAYVPDPSERLRNLLRDTAVLNASEFSNVREVLAQDEDFADRAYLWMVGQYGMRNVVTYFMDKVKPLAQQDSEDNPVIDLAWLRTRPSWSAYHQAALNTEMDAFTGSRGGIQTDEFWTFPIATGRVYQKFCLLAKVAYASYTVANSSGDLWKNYIAYDTTDGPVNAKVLWVSDGGGTYATIYPILADSYSFDSQLITHAPVAASIKIIFDFTYGEPLDLAPPDDARYVYDTFCDLSYYSRLELYQVDPTHVGVKYVRHSPYQADDTAFDVSIAVTAGHKLRFTFDHTDSANSSDGYGNYNTGARSVTIENLSASTSQTESAASGWFKLYTGINSYGHYWSPRVGIGIHHEDVYNSGDLGYHAFLWFLTSITFSDCGSDAMATWRLSRLPDPDVGDFEGDFDALTGTEVNLGDSPEGAVPAITVWCRVSAPAMVQAFAVGWDVGEGGGGGIT